MTTTKKAQTNLGAWRGHDLIDADGKKVGLVDEVYVDSDTGEPEWVAVTTGMFGTRCAPEELDLGR